MGFSMEGASGIAELAIVRAIKSGSFKPVMGATKFFESSQCLGAGRWNDTFYLGVKGSAEMISPTLVEWHGTASLTKRNNVGSWFNRGHQSIQGVINIDGLIPKAA